MVQLIKMMDNMLLKAGVEQQSEELTELSQVRQTDRQTDIDRVCRHKSQVSAAQ